MSKKAAEEFKNIPENPDKEPVKKSAIELEIESFKKKYGIELEPVKNNKYKIKKVMEFLGQHYEFRYNLFAKKPEFRRLEEKKYEFFDERALDNLYNNIDINGNSISQGRLLSLIGSNLISSDYDPILEYIMMLPKWDGKDRFPLFLTQISLNDEKANRDFLIKAFRKWFVTMVASLVNTDIINEVAIVFSGQEGRGKTRFFINLIPKDLRLKYLFVGNFNPRDKDHEEMLGTKILIFLDEMATLNRVDSEIIKTTMSKRTVTLRRAYGRGEINLFRRSSFAGSINDDRFLTDQGANRRWIPFAIDSIDVDNDFDIGLLYAQALALYKDGFDIYYDRDEIDALKERNEQFRRRSPEEDLILLHWCIPTKEDIDTCSYLEYLTPTDVMYDLSGRDAYKKMNTNDSVAKRIGKTLASLGFPPDKKRLKHHNNQCRDCYIMKPVNSSVVIDIKKGKSSVDEPEAFNM
jgi:predicted P-loop ATPase